MTGPQYEGDDLLDGADEEPAPEMTLGQQLSRLGRIQLQAEAKKRGLSAAGTNPDIIARIEMFEANGGVVTNPADMAGGAPAPAPIPAPVNLPAAPPAAPPVTPPAAAAAPSTPAGGVASAPAGPPPAPEPPARPVRQKVGFFAALNTWRAEFPIGPRDVDDSTHMTLIEATHDNARQSGYRTLGYPHAGVRVGYSNDTNGVRTAVYEVYAREVE